MWPITEINSLNIEMSQLDSAKSEPRPLPSCIIKTVSIARQCFKLNWRASVITGCSTESESAHKGEENCG